jgi:hypothetical protein
MGKECGEEIVMSKFCLNLFQVLTTFLNFYQKFNGFLKIKEFEILKFKIC